MNITTNYMHEISKWMFFLLFPVVFLYNGMVEFDFIPAFLKGGVGVFIVLSFILLFPMALLTVRRLGRSSLRYFSLFIGLVLFVLSYLVINYIFGSPLHRRPDVMEQWLVLIISWCAMFSIGYFFPKKLSTMNVWVLIIAIICMSVLVFESIHFLHSDPNKSILTLGRVNSEEVFMTYQGYARAMSVTGLVVLAVIRNQIVFWTMSLIILGSLFLIGGRSEFIGTLMIFPIFIFYHFSVRPKLTIGMVVIVSVIIATLFTIKFKESNHVRYMELLDVSKSISFQLRKKLNTEALEAIVEKPLIGDFSGHARERVDLGYYAHNILSSWRQLGLVGFLFYSALIFWPVFSTFGLIRREPDLLQIDIWRILGVMSVFSLLLALGVKSIFWPVAALSWGMFVAALQYLETDNKSNLPDNENSH